MVLAEAVLIATEAQRTDLMQWAKKQGRKGRLFGGPFMVGGKRLVVNKLKVD